MSGSPQDGLVKILRSVCGGLPVSDGAIWWSVGDRPLACAAALDDQDPKHLRGTLLPLPVRSRCGERIDPDRPPLRLRLRVDLAGELGFQPRLALFFGVSGDPLERSGQGVILVGDRPGGTRIRWRAADLRQAATLAMLANSAAETLAVRDAARQTSMQAVLALAQAVDAKDHYTHMHSRSVANMAAAVATRLGLSPAEVENTRMAGLLHDVGKIGIPDAILNKPGPLDPAETLQMRQHSAMGDRITKTIDALRYIAPLVRAHHERWDGLGYPDRLKGEAIPLPARIVTVADAFDAMTSDRVYRPGRSIAKAAEELLRERGSQFDPAVVDALVAYIGERLPNGGAASAEQAS